MCFYGTMDSFQYRKAFVLSLEETEIKKRKEAKIINVDKANAIALIEP